MKLPLLFSITTALLTLCILFSHQPSADAHSADKSCRTPPAPTIPSDRTHRYSTSNGRQATPHQRYTPVDIVLVTLLDGSIRGIGRYDGRVYWTIRGGTQASLVKSSTQYKSRLVPDSLLDQQQQQQQRQSFVMADNILDDDDDDDYNDDDYSDLHYDDPENHSHEAPLLGATQRALQTGNEEKAVGFLSRFPQDHNISYIIEPVNGGIMYLQVDGEPLQKLPFTMKNIVDRSVVIEDNMMYIGGKSTLMIALDPITGNILRKFDLHDSQYEMMMATKHKLPSHTIYLARNEYKVRINDLKTNMSWRLTYSEYEPKSMNWDVPEGMEALDTYITPDTNRVMAAINQTDGNILWMMDLPYPAVTVFNMYRTPDFSLILNKQSTPAQLNLGRIGDLISTLNPHRQNSIYISVHGGTLYALSAEHFPLVQLAEWSFAETGEMPGVPMHLIDSGDTEFDRQSKYNTDKSIYRADKLVGRHKIDTGLLLPSPSLPLIEGPSDDDTQTPFSESEHTITNTYAQRFFDTAHYWQLSSLILLLTAGFMGRKRGWEWVTLYIAPLVNHYIHNNNNNSTMIQPDVKPDHDADSSSTPIESTDKPSDDPDTITSSLKPVGLDLQDFRPAKSSVLDISEDVLGYGSHGTVVYKGTFDGRAVAVKRLLIDFYDMAIQEVKLLQESDDHPNVVRYFYKEESDRFLYIALELCFGSLQDCMDRSLAIPDMKLYDLMDPANSLFQITSGIQHLHSLKIVHRDLKPQNILLAPSKHGSGQPSLRILISDFGLCKKLDGEQSSFHYTAASPAGTSGWRAPELLAGALAASTSASDHTTTFSNNSSNGKDPNRIGRVKATRSIDIFSAGCIFYYVLSNGDHPFGNRFGRETNILQGDYDITKLEDMGEDGMEAMDLIDAMISANPRSRPTADKILAHPFFWSTSKRLSFLQDASDRFEIEQRDPPSPLLQSLEKDAKEIVGYDWYRRIDRVVVNDLGKFRKYDGKRVRDLLRALRNKKHHWQDLPEPVRRALGEPPDQYLYYFTARFPRLLLHTYHIISNNESLTHEGALRHYF